MIFKIYKPNYKIFTKYYNIEDNIYRDFFYNNYEKCLKSKKDEFGTRFYVNNKIPSMILYGKNGNILAEYWFNEEGGFHRDNDLPSFIGYYENGVIKKKEWCKNGEGFCIRPDDKPNLIEYNEQGKITKEFWYTYDTGPYGTISKIIEHNDIQNI